MDTAILARIKDVQNRMVRHSKAITKAYDFPACLWTGPEDVRHHIRMLSMLAYGLQQLND